MLACLCMDLYPYHHMHSRLYQIQCARSRRQPATSFAKTWRTIPKDADTNRPPRFPPRPFCRAANTLRGRTISGPPSRADYSFPMSKPIAECWASRHRECKLSSKASQHLVGSAKLEAGANMAAVQLPGLMVTPLILILSNLQPRATYTLQIQLFTAENPIYPRPLSLGYLLLLTIYLTTIPLQLTLDAGSVGAGGKCEPPQR